MNGIFRVPMFSGASATLETWLLVAV
jgi:hypothetical protein